MPAGWPAGIGRIILVAGPQLRSHQDPMFNLATVKRELRGIALALLMVLAMTVVAYVLVSFFEIRRGSVIYLIPVLLAGWHLGLIPALVAAVAGVLWSGYFFYFP